MSTFYKTKNGYLVKQIWDEEEAVMHLITKDNEMLQPVFEDVKGKDEKVYKKLVGFMCPNGEVINDFNNDKGEVKNISLQGLSYDIFPPSEAERQKATAQASTDAVITAGNDTKSRLLRRAMGLNNKPKNVDNNQG